MSKELKKWIKDLGITVQGQGVFFKDKKVYTLNEGEESIPALWCIRADDPTTEEDGTVRHFWGFVTGFDLSEKKEMCWLGSIQPDRHYQSPAVCSAYHRYLDDVFYMLKNFCHDIKDKDWTFIPEESFEESGELQMIKIFED